MLGAFVSSTACEESRTESGERTVEGDVRCSICVKIEMVPQGEITALRGVVSVRLAECARHGSTGLWNGASQAASASGLKAQGQEPDLTSHHLTTPAIDVGISSCVPLQIQHTRVDSMCISYANFY